MICKKCGSVNNDDDNFCWNCGDNLTAQATPVAKTTPPPPKQPTYTPVKNNPTPNTNASTNSTRSNEEVLRSAKKCAILSYCFFGGFIISLFIRLFVAVVLSSFIGYSDVWSIFSFAAVGLIIASIVLAVVGKVKLDSRRLKSGMVNGAFWMNIGFVIALILLCVLAFFGIAFGSLALFFYIISLIPS